VSIFIYENRKSKVSNKNENIHKCDFIKSLKYHDEEWGVHTDNIHLMSEELFASPE